MADVARWASVPLIEVLDFREGPGILAKDFHESGVPLIRLAGVKRGANILDGCNFLDPALVEKKWSHFRLRHGDVLLSTSASLGEVAVVEDKGVGAVPYTGLIGFRPRDERVSPRFVPIALTSRSFKAQIEAMGVGSVMKHFGPMHLRQMSVEVPPLGVQEGIADVVEALDDKIAANTKLATTANDLATLLYGRTVSAVGRVPMSSRLDPILGGTPSRSRPEFWGGDVPWTSARDITGAGHGVVLETAEHVTGRAASTTKAKPLPEGSVILTARGTVGAVARLGVPAAFNQSCYGFVPGDTPPGVLYYAVLSAAEEARSLAHGSVFDTITMSTFDHLGFPDLDDTSMMALECEIGPLLDSVTAIERENYQLAATRDALLPALMSGKLRVEEAAEVAGL